MTTLIQQRSPNDCVLAAIAMAAGKSSWDEVWSQEDLDSVIKSRGIADTEPWLLAAGFKKGSWFEVYIHDAANSIARAMLWKRRALLSVDSLNNAHGSHMVYWDGARVWDPHEGHYPTYIAFRHLSSCNLSRAYIFDDEVKS